MKKSLLYVIILVIGLSTPTFAQTEKDHIVRVALNGGWTIWRGDSPDFFPEYYLDYLKDVRQGLSWGADAQFNINNLFTIGVFYDRFAQSASCDIPNEYTLYHTPLNINNTYTIDYLAMSLGVMKTFKQHRFSLNYLIGFTDYREAGNYLVYNYLMINRLESNYTVGHCLGHGAMITYDYMINKHFAFGAELTYCFGSVSKLNHQGRLTSGAPSDTFITTVTQLNEPIELHRLSPKIGLRYYF